MIYVKVKVTPWQAYVGTQGRRWYSYNPFATSALEGGEWSVSHCGRFTPGKYPVGFRAGLNGHEKSRPLYVHACKLNSVNYTNEKRSTQ